MKTKEVDGGQAGQGTERAGSFNVRVEEEGEKKSQRRRKEQGLIRTWRRTGWSRHLTALSPDEHGSGSIPLGQCFPRREPGGRCFIVKGVGPEGGCGQRRRSIGPVPWLAAGGLAPGNMGIKRKPWSRSRPSAREGLGYSMGLSVQRRCWTVPSPGRRWQPPASPS